MKKIVQIILLITISSYSSLVFSFNEASAMLENEKNSIQIFASTVKSVVYISNIQKVRRGFFDLTEYEMPAGAGTGYVWDEFGHIVTNFHVIDGGDKFLVSFEGDKTQYEAKYIGGSPNKDIAVLKLVKKPKILYPISIGESKSLKVGQKAIAIGNPFGLDHTMTAGIISALNRKIKGFGGVSISGMIQTDASINPGNSGGPLLNSSGELIGMNTMIFSQSGTSAGVGFAVPVDTIKRIVPQLIKYGKVIRPGLGIVLLPDQMKARFGLEKGVVIAKISPTSPAAKAGLQGMSEDIYGRIFLGDIILEIDGVETNSFDDIYQVLDKHKVGDKVVIKFLRDDKIKTTTIPLIQLN